MILVLLIMGACAAKTTGDSEDSKNDQQGITDKENRNTETIEFVYWAAAGGEEEAFRNLIADFEAANPNIKVKAQQVPPPQQGDYYTKIRTRIAGNDAPDVFRVQYQMIGEFASQDALLDVSDVVGPTSDKFHPSLLTAVSLNNKIYGLPHHTDTLAVFYNKTYLDKLGIHPPTRIEKAWTWEEMLSVAKKIQDEKLASYGIAFNWKESSAYRSLPFFFQNGATLLTSDLKQANVNTPEAIETLRFLKKMFERYMSEGNSMKGSDDINLLFTSGKAGLLVSGNWMIPKWEEEMKNYEWGVTYMPVKKSPASDLGGNALAIPVNSKHPEAAKKFLEFMGEKENMKKFVEQGLFLPARTDIEGPLDYRLNNPDMMNLFIEQASTVPEELARTITIPQFAKINQALAESLEAMFKMGLSPEETAETLQEEINSILND